VLDTDGRPRRAAETTELFTVDQLAEISQNPDAITFDLAGDRAALVPEMKRGGIVTKNQITAFLANVSQETDRLKTLEEYGDEAYFRYGESCRPPAKYLGDQWRYHGRGYIMNTWRDAYQRLSSVLGVNLVSNPELLATRKDLAARAAVWFWTTNNIGPVADRGDFKGVCSLINRGENPPKGPINGWEERLAAYKRAQSVIGTGTEPVEETDGTPATTEIVTAKEGTNFYKGLYYIRPIIGHREYWVWSGGIVPAGEGCTRSTTNCPPSRRSAGSTAPV
jgi:predicted chitinase